MKLISRGSTTVREDGLPYDVVRVQTNVYQFRATGNPSNPVVIATTDYNSALMMLVAQAPEISA